jgi:glucosamine--fructose-6-phosphate aminotransferase (isomerizing)
MCEIFGLISKTSVNKKSLRIIVKHSEQRGVGPSGLIHLKDSGYQVNRVDLNVEKLLGKINPYNSNIFLEHSRSITNGLGDNQPIVKNNLCVIHNGIMINEKEVWENLVTKRELTIDSESTVSIASGQVKNEAYFIDIPKSDMHLKVRDTPIRKENLIPVCARAEENVWSVSEAR